MDIQNLQQTIINQVKGTGNLSLNDTILASADIALIQKDFGLSSGEYLVIKGLTTSDIPQPTGDEISFQKGSLSVFKQSSLSVDICFKVISGDVQLILQIELPQIWKWTDSFTNLTVFPFNQVNPDKSLLIYSTVVITKLTPAFNTYPKHVSLAAGLNLVSMLPLTGITVLANLLGRELPNSFLLFFGAFSVQSRLPYPVCELKALLLESSSKVLPGVSLNDLYLTVQITDPGTSLIQDFSFGIETQSDTFNYFISFGYDSGNVNFQVSPNASSPTTLETLVKSNIVKSILPTDTDFSSWVPSELNTAFESIAFLGAGFGFSLSQKKVVYVHFKIGQNPSSGPITLGPLSFSKLALNASWINYGQGLTPTFNFSGETDVKLKAFTVPINFMISVDKSTSSYEIAIAEAQVQSAISLSQLVSEVDSSGTVPRILQDFYLGDFYFRYDHSAGTYTGSFVGAYSPQMFNSLFSADIAIALTKTASGWDANLGGGFAIGNEGWVDIDIELQETDGHKEFAFSGTSNIVPLGSLISELANELGITDYSFIDFDITDFKIDYNKNTLNEASISGKFQIGSTTETFSLKGKKNTTTDKWEFYANVDVSAGTPIDLGSMIPIVGSELSGMVTFDDVGLYITSKSIDEFSSEEPDLVPGLSMSLKGSLGGEAVNPVIPLYVYKSSGETGGDNGDAEILSVMDSEGTSTQTPSQNIKWFDFSKTIGPVTLKKFGFLPSGDNVAIYPDIVLSKGGVELDLDGLSISVSVKELLQKKLNASFSIDGLGVSYQSDTLKLSGQFLKNTVTSPPPNSKSLTGYLGEVIAHFSRFGLTAIGGYIPEQDGYPESLFIYANLDGTLGGPPALYVTGIAFGFGLNYKLIPPTLKDLSTYALLPQNNPPKAGNSSDISTSLSSLQNTVIQEQPGENWIAAGIQVTSYNMISGFALVSVSFGLETYIGILGSVSMTLPKGDPEPLGFVEIDATINFNPASGLLPILGVVSPSSYFLDGVIALTGGFAFYIWYGGANKGNFVFTIGGYYPSFTIPVDYPKVAPLGINFDMGPFKADGSAYLALTPGAFMAGFRFTASWSFANISAWYSLGLDFLVEWAPFSYQGDAYVSVGVSVELALFTVHASIGADAVVWGPKFGGKAHVDLDVVSFTIHFGSDKATPPPVDWEEFEKKFLPSGLSQQGGDSRTQDLMTMVATPAQSGKNVSASAAKGLLKSGITVGGVAYDWLMDPNHFEIDTATKIPANYAYWTSAKGTEYTIPNVAAGTAASATNPEVNPFPGDTTWCTIVNLKPMKLSDVKSKHTITLIKADNDGSFTSASAQYINDISITPLFNNSNAALWGKVESSDKKDPNNQLLDNTLEGFTITPMPRNPSKVSQLPLIDLIFAEGNNEYFNYTQKNPDTTYTVTVPTDTDTELEIDITGGTPPPSALTNENLVLNSLINSWVEGKRNPILDELNTHFNTFKSSEVTLTDMATTEQLNNWPQVEILGA